MLIRPENVFITALSVYVAGLISSIHGLQFGADLSKAALSAALIAAGGNIFNDYCDRDLDRIQKPHRPNRIVPFPRAGFRPVPRFVLRPVVFFAAF